MALIQSKYGDDEVAWATSLTVTLDSPTTGGNTLHIALLHVATFSSLVCSDSTVPTQIGSQESVGLYYKLRNYYVPNCPAGITSLTLTGGSADLLELLVTEWSGLAASPFDVAAASGDVLAPSASVTTTQANDLLISSILTNLKSTITWGNGSVQAATGGHLRVASRTGGSAGSETSSATLSNGSDDAVLQINAFKVAAAPSGSGRGLLLFA